MTYFDKVRKFTGYVRSVSPKNKKVKQSAAEGGGDAGTKLVILVTLDVPLTGPMQKSLSPAVQSWITANKDAATGAEKLERANPSKEKPLLILTKWFDEGAKEASHTQGSEDDRRVTLQVLKYFFLPDETEPRAQLRLVADFDKALWIWLGSHMEASNNAIQLETKALQKALQKVLPFGREEKAEDDE